MRILAVVVSLLSQAQPVQVGPVTLLEEYQRNELAADDRFLDKRLRMIGLVAEIRKDAFGEPVVELSARSAYTVHLRFSETSLSKLAQLWKGQLVGVECTGKGMVLGTPQLAKCVLGWAEPTDVEPIATQATASYEICTIENYDASYKAALEAGHRADGGVLPSKQHVEKLKRVAAGVRAGAERDLTKLGLPRLPCDHILVAVMSRCDEDDGRTPQCKAKIVKAMSKHFHR